MTLNDGGIQKMFIDVNEKVDVRFIGNVLKFQFLEPFFFLWDSIVAVIFSPGIYFVCYF